MLESQFYDDEDEFRLPVDSTTDRVQHHAYLYQVIEFAESWNQ